MRGECFLGERIELASASVLPDRRIELLRIEASNQARSRLSSPGASRWIAFSMSSAVVIS
jgi:hypothetical protein